MLILQCFICAPCTCTQNQTGYQLESLSIFKSLNTSSLKSTKSFYALSQSDVWVPAGALACHTLLHKEKQAFFFALSFKIIFKILLEALDVEGWLYSGRNGRGLGLATKAASPSCTGILAFPKVSLSAFPLLMHFKKRQQSDIPSKAFVAPKLMLTSDKPCQYKTAPVFIQKSKRNISLGDLGRLDLPFTVTIGKKAGA